jgi:competence protein ComEC
MFQFTKSRIFILVLLFFIIGIACASLVKFDKFFIYFFILISFLIFLLSSKQLVKIFAILFLFFLLGILRYQFFYPKINESKIYFYNEKKVIFEGKIIKEPELKEDKILLTVKAEKMNNQKVSGKVLVLTQAYPIYQYGQILEIDCKLEKVYDLNQFYHEYLASNDIYSTCFSSKIKILKENKGNLFFLLIFKLKEKVKNLIDQNLTEPQGYLFSALILGLKKNFPNEVIEWFRKTGTSHIIVISGMHILILIKLLESLFFYFGFSRNFVFYLVSFIIIFYIVLTGASPSAIRAGIMGILLLFAFKVNRLYQPINAILLALFLMLLFNPKLLLWNVGFQLSFLSILGLIYLSPILNHLLKDLIKYEAIRKSLSTTFGAYLFTLPLVLYYFGNLSLSAFLANILILGILPYLMFLGFIFIVFGLFFNFLAKILIWPVWLLLTYILFVIKFLANVPFLSFNLKQIPLFLLIFLYIILIFITIKLNQKYKSMT